MGHHHHCRKACPPAPCAPRATAEELALKVEECKCKHDHHHHRRHDHHDHHAEYAVEAAKECR